MRIVMNGDQMEVPDSCSVATLLVKLGIGADRVAVELNADIIPKAGYEKQLLSDNDRIEIVHFVGGG